MTEREKTVTDHLLEAQSIIDSKELLTGDDMERVRECLERALATMNVRRCEAQAALDQL